MPSQIKEITIKLDDFSFPFRYQIAKNRKLNTIFMDDCTFIWDIETSVKEEYEKRNNNGKHSSKNN